MTGAMVDAIFAGWRLCHDDIEEGLVVPSTNGPGIDFSILVGSVDGKDVGTCGGCSCRGIFVEATGEIERNCDGVVEVDSFGFHEGAILGRSGVSVSLGRTEGLYVKECTDGCRVQGSSSDGTVVGCNEILVGTVVGATGDVDGNNFGAGNTRQEGFVVEIDENTDGDEGCKVGAT